MAKSIEVHFRASVQRWREQIIRISDLEEHNSNLAERLRVSEWLCDEYMQLNDKLEKKLELFNDRNK